jgi:integrase
VFATIQLHGKPMTFDDIRAEAIRWRRPSYWLRDVDRSFAADISGSTTHAQCARVTHAPLYEAECDAVLLTAIFTGLRASELRGVAWANVDLARGALKVRQRADAYGRIGSPKSAAGSRTVPLPPLVANTLREWKLAQPQTDLVFAAPSGQAVAMSTLVYGLAASAARSWNHRRE